jgi:hypothetical protein
MRASKHKGTFRNRILRFVVLAAAGPADRASEATRLGRWWSARSARWAAWWLAVAWLRAAGRPAARRSVGPCRAGVGARWSAAADGGRQPGCRRTRPREILGDTSAKSAGLGTGSHCQLVGHGQHRRQGRRRASRRRSPCRPSSTVVPPHSSRGCQKLGCHAAYSYSWIRPPRRSRRRSRPTFGPLLGPATPDGSGVAWAKLRCGRHWL